MISTRSESHEKYELTDEIKTIVGHTLHRIRACVDVGNNVKAGDFGGWIESEINLSHDGDAWVCDNAWVHGNALVCDNAVVRGGAWDKSPLYIQGSKWSVCMTNLTHIQIGCQNHSISDWIDHGVAIARRNHADDIIPEYIWYIVTAAMRYGTADERERAQKLLAEVYK